MLRLKNALKDEITQIPNFRIIDTNIPSNAQTNTSVAIYEESGITDNYYPIGWAIYNSGWYIWNDGNVGSISMSSNKIFIWFTAAVLAGKRIKVLLIHV